MSEDWLELLCTENLPRITVDQVQQELQKINVNKAPGPYDPILKILKNFAKYFAIPLTEIFNESFQWKIFSKAWKKCKVLGIPKSVPCTLVEDLRPIALKEQCHISRIFSFPFFLPFYKLLMDSVQLKQINCISFTLFYIQRQQIAAKSLSLQRLHPASIFAFSYASNILFTK